MKSIFNQIISGIKDLCYICAQELKATFKDLGMLIFFIVVPIAYPLLYSWMYNNQVVREVPVAVVDMSNSSTSREFIRKYDASPDVRIAYRCTNLEEAKKLLGHQEVFGILHFPESFEKNIARKEQATVGVYCDMGIMLHYKAIYQTATAVVGNINSKIQIEGSNSFTVRDEELTTRPLDFDEVPIFSPTGGYGDFIIPAVLILILHQTLLLGIGMGAGTARESNKYSNLIPNNRHYRGMFRVLFGKTAGYFIVYLFMSAYMLLLVPHLFGWIQIAQTVELIAIVIPFLLATIFFGLTLSCIVRYRENVMLLIVFTSVPLLFLSGVSWPESAMPSVWRSIAYLFPSTFGVRAFVRINTMGASIYDVQYEYHALWIQVLVYFITSSIIFRLQVAAASKRAATSAL